MATLTIELSQEAAARLAKEAALRGIDVETYFRQLLGDKIPGETGPCDVDPRHASRAQSPLAVADISWLDSTKAVVAAIQARGPGQVPVQEATANLAQLLQNGGVDPGISPAEWDRRWAAHEARQKSLDLADRERTLSEMQGLLAEDDRNR